MAREGGGGQVPSAKRLADGSHGVAHARHGADLRGKGAAVRGREEGKSSAYLKRRHHERHERLKQTRERNHRKTRK